MANSDSHRRIYAVVGNIPEGKVATYGQIATLAGLPRQARLVGYALHSCPKNLPWHRVINAQGRISLPSDATSAMMQRRRLQAEGITFLGGKIELARYRWEPDNAD